MKQLVILIGVSLFFFSHSRSQVMSTADSLDLKIGQMIMIGWNGTSVDPFDPAIDGLLNDRVGGVIFFEKNISPTDSYRKLLKMSMTLQQKTRIPLLIAIDQEGGLVNRLKPKYGFPGTITAAEMGLNPDSTIFYGNLTAGILATLGINLNFAPVADLATNPDNPIIAKYGRAFSDDPEEVALHNQLWIETHRYRRVHSVMKHFPGHGSSKEDTHLGMADVTPNWDEIELIPYKKLIESGHVAGIMTAHVVNKNLDPSGLPSTLSKKIVQGLLRDEMGFNGVVFSDDMQMHAITKHYGLEKSIELGINAGLDVLIFSNNIHGSQERTADKVHKIIKDLVKEGKITPERIDASFRRIMKFKEPF